ncbi:MULTISPECIES: PEP-CTERM sorting domain-containing protein [Cyanophyceae]|uniref:PEP-CTERM sorting domain-containing protein n=1 Tax=Cyanophyceae TaxID=3028117 RepID=UPI0016837B6A|nr:PEP-CTERM sorting domain-containing protein [Trichocoleus sp. FACHB-69]MBD1930478.1 PEP-CTERM sorting domain-containing protein [Trichocoleus sp. FACHB-69]
MRTSFLKKLSTGVVGATLIVGTGVAPSQATTLTGFSTFGDMMAGMKVTVDYLGGGSQTATWGATSNPATSNDANSGGAFGSNWSLTQAGDTFTSAWRFNNLGQSIAKLTINAIPGNTVFDTGSNPSTPGSASGLSFAVQSGQAPTSSNYSTPIDISLGDLFGTLSMSWLNGFTGGMSFKADTDSGTTTDPVQPPIDVPEPASAIALLGLGALGVTKRAKRKQEQQA